MFLSKLLNQMGNKKIVVFLSAVPKDGGKFQYGLSMLNACLLLESNEYKFIYVYKEDIWLDYIPVNYSRIKLKPNYFFVKVVKNVLIKLFPNFGYDLWREIGFYIDKNHQTFKEINPDLIIYAGKDPFIHELKMNGVIPIFDLMHKYENFPELNSGNIYKEREIYYQRLCKYAKGVMVDSEIGKLHVLENYEIEKSKIFVVPYVPPSYVFEIKHSYSIEKFNLPDEFIFYPAQFWQHKNHRAIVEALNILKDKGIIINCVFVGAKKNSFQLVNDLVIKYQLNKQIFYLDYVSNNDLVGLYKMAKALVMPTLLGPTNIPPLEAIALNCPVITSNIYGIPEQMADAAILVNP